MLLPSKLNGGFKINGGKQRKFPSHTSAFLCSVKQEVMYTAKREGEIGKIRDLKRLEKARMIFCGRGRKGWIKLSRQC